METIQIKIDVNKIEKSRLFKGAKGTYLDATLVMRDEPDQYGNIGFVTQQISKEEREAGTKAPIIGNVTKRYVKDAPKPQAPAPVTPIVSSVDDSDLPF
jgi:hypothetical protein